MFNLSLRGQLLLFVFFLALTTMAEVKKEFGEFAVTHADSLKNQVLIQRFYSSRSLYKGLFGFNWCSTLDYRLNFQADEIKVYDCELGRSIRFRKTNKNVFRNEAENLEVTEIDRQWRMVRSQRTYVFSMDGLLNHWIDEKKNTIFIEYKSGFMHRILLKGSSPLILGYSSEGLVEKIGPDLVYKYTQNLLKKVTILKKTKWHYQYDEFLNMTLWRGPSSYESMKYDSEWDRIVYLKDQNNCRFRFQYELKKSRKFIVESKKCINAAERETLFEVVTPRLLVKSPNDQLGKEYRQGANNEDTF